MGNQNQLWQGPTAEAQKKKRSRLHGASQPFIVDYAKYRDLCHELREDATDVAFVAEDPRRMYLLPNGARNIYFLPYLLLGEMIETDDRRSLEFLSGTGIDFQDEFDRQEYIARFRRRNGEQKRALAHRMFYSEIRIDTPPFDFDSGTYSFSFDGYRSDKDLAYQVRSFQFIWENNLRGFDVRFDLPFSDPETAKRWKRIGNFVRIGLVFEVLGYLPRLWSNGMPTTICYVRGFHLVSGVEAEPIVDLPGEIVGIAGERADRLDRDQIQTRVGQMSSEGWEPI